MLKDIRNANAREGTFKWSRDFLYSLFSKNVRPSINKTNISMALLGLGICVAVPILGAAALAGTYVLPAVFGLFGLFVLCKLVQAVYNTWQDANKLATQSKTASGEKILERVAAFDKNNSATAKKDMEKAKADKARVDTTIAQKQSELDAEILRLKTPLTNKVAELDEEAKTLEKLKTKQCRIRDGRGGRVYTLDQIDAARRAVTTIEENLRVNAADKLGLEANLTAIDTSPEVLALRDEINDLMITELVDATQNLADTTAAYTIAEEEAVKSRDRANKIDTSTNSEPSLREIFGDQPSSGASGLPRRR